MDKTITTLGIFDNDDCSVFNKYRIDKLGREIKITTQKLPIKIEIENNLIIKDVEIEITDEYENKTIDYCDVFYNYKEEKYYLYFNKDYDVEYMEEQLKFFIEDFIESNGFELTKYTTPFLANVDLDYMDKYTPEELSDNAKNAIKKARELGYQNLVSLFKNGTNEHKKLIDDIFK